MDLTSNPMSTAVTKNIVVGAQVEEAVVPDIQNAVIALGVTNADFRNFYSDARGWIGTTTETGSKSNQFTENPFTGNPNWQDVKVLAISKKYPYRCLVIDYKYPNGLGQQGYFYGGIYDPSAKPWTLIKLVKSSNAPSA